MTNFTGAANASILIGKEVTEGTPVATDKDIGIVKDLNWGGANEVVQTRGMSSRDLDKLDIGQWRFRGDVTFDFQHGRLLEYAFGAVVDSGVGDPFTHDVSGTDVLPSFTAAIGLDGSGTDDEETYAGCKVNSLTIAQDLGGNVTTRAEILAITLATDATPAAAITDDLVCFPSGFSDFAVGSAASEVSVAQARAFEFTINNNLIPTDRFGSFLPDTHEPGVRDYTARVTLAFTDDNERSRFLGGTTGITSPDLDGFDNFSAIFKAIRSSGDRQLEVTMSDVRYISYARPITVGDLILQDLELNFKTSTIQTKDDINVWN